MKRMNRFSVDEQRQKILNQVFDLSDKFWMWTNKELAEEAGLSPSTISKLRRVFEQQVGIIDIRSSTLLKLCKAVELEIYLNHKKWQKGQAA